MPSRGGCRIQNSADGEDTEFLLKKADTNLALLSPDGEWKETEST